MSLIVFNWWQKVRSFYLCVLSSRKINVSFIWYFVLKSVIICFRWKHEYTIHNAIRAWIYCCFHKRKYHIDKIDKNLSFLRNGHRAQKHFILTLVKNIDTVLYQVAHDLYTSSSSKKLDVIQCPLSLQSLM